MIVADYSGYRWFQLDAWSFIASWLVWIWLSLPDGGSWGAEGEWAAGVVSPVPVFDAKTFYVISVREMVVFAIRRAPATNSARNYAIMEHPLDDCRWPQSPSQLFRFRLLLGVLAVLAQLRRAVPRKVRCVTISGGLLMIIGE